MKGYVYILCDPVNEAYKIGVTRSLVSKRMKKLQTGNATELHMVNYYECEHPFRVESMLHSKFFNKNLLNEWFALDADDVSSFIDECRKAEKNIEALKSNPFFSKLLNPENPTAVSQE